MKETRREYYLKIRRKKMLSKFYLQKYVAELNQHWGMRVDGAIVKINTTRLT